MKDNLGEVEKRLGAAMAETEVELPSGDRVDVVIYGESATVAVEVKSGDSDWHDFRRGIYQCVKYRAVLRAQEVAAQEDRPPVRARLVTESRLDGDSRALAKRLGVKHKIVRPPPGKEKKGLTKRPRAPNLPRPRRLA